MASLSRSWRHLKRSGEALVLTAYLLVASTVFGGLSMLAHLQERFFFDLPTTLTAQSWREPVLDAVMRAISWPGYPPQWLLMFGIVLVALVMVRWRLEAAILAVAELGVGATGFLLKPIVDRHRPPASLVWIGDAENVKGDPYTFTAGHVHTAVVMFGWLSFLVIARLPRESMVRKLTIAGSALLLVLTGISRVYLGDHWLSDVLGGYLLGSIWLALEILYYRTLAEPTRRAAAQASKGLKRLLPGQRRAATTPTTTSRTPRTRSR